MIHSSSRPASQRLGVAAAALAGLVGSEEARQLPLLLRAEARAVADHLQLAVVVVQAQDQRAERALLLAGAPADHHRVDRAHALHLHHPGALARTVGGVELLGDHALRALEPRLGLRAVERARRQVERLARRASRAARAGARTAHRAAPRRPARAGRTRRTAPASPRPAVRTRDSAGWMRCWSASNSWRPSVAQDHQLAVEHVLARREPQFREIAPQRPPVARLEEVLVAVHERDRPEPVPLRLVRPALALGQLRLAKARAVAAPAGRGRSPGAS